jgi:hypothetical protein
VELSSQTIPSDAESTFHRQSLHEYYTSNTGTYTFRAQFASNTSSHPVEDASVEWDEVTAPWHDLAEIIFEPQETFSQERRIWWEDHMALSPWDGLKAHRPLGSINRLRKKVYAMSRRHREEGSLVEVDFPKTVDEMPA